MKPIEEIQNENKIRKSNILHAFGVSEEMFEKAKSGIYQNTSENRRLGRVGQKYGKPGDKEENEATQKQKEKDMPSFTKQKLLEQRKRLVRRNEFISTKKSNSHEVRMELRKNNRLIEEIDKKVKN